jgi:tol-pal system-associated acyl-CoA thioesterase
MFSHPIFIWPVRVYYEDTDAGGVVYHSQYLNFLERARTEWLRHFGFEHARLRNDFNVVFVVHSLQIQFKKSAKLDDLLSIASHVDEIGRASFSFLQTINVNQQTLVTAQVKLACVNASNFKPMAFPRSLLEKIDSDQLKILI